MLPIDSLKQALAVSPDNAPLLLMLGNAYLEQFSLDEARQQFERVLALDPAHREARVAIAQILDLNGKTSEAVIRLEQLCAEAPNHAPAWLLRAKLALNEGDAQSARQCYDRGAALNPALADSELLKRIEQAGGRREAASDGADRSSGGRATPQSAGGWQAGAYFEADPEFGGGGDDEDEEDDVIFGEVFEGLPHPDDLELEFLQKADVNFAHVGGMNAVKEDIRMKILYPIQNAELFAAYGKKAGGGVLLYGPPGCGKTLIARATAGEIKAKFLSVGLHQILDMWIGKSEEKLHEIFELARRQAPAVLFFDEVDALAADRKDMRTSAGRTLINQFLAEMDGNLGANDGVLVLGATNAPWHLDSAFLRPGRFDRLIFVPPPDLPARAEIIQIMATGKPIVGLEPEALAKKIDDFSGADIKALFDQAIEAALGEAMKTGKIVPISQKLLLNTAKQVKPSTRKWFESAKNYALYANQSGFYDDVLNYLGIQKR